MPSKFEFNKGKMVPYPSGAIVPDRDLGQRPALECIHLGIEFGGLKAVDDFSLTIGKTEIAGLIGPNGAGKTTVFNLLTKVYQPTHGTILLDGEDTSGKSVYQVNRMGIARTFQNIRLWKSMTVFENVLVAKHMRAKQNVFSATFRGNAKEEKRMRQRAGAPRWRAAESREAGLPPKQPAPDMLRARGGGIPGSQMSVLGARGG